MSDTYKADAIVAHKFAKMIWHDHYAVETSHVTPGEIFEDGLRRGMHRCTEGMPCTAEQHEQAVDRVRQLFTNSETFSTGRQWSARGAALFVELITIGTYARVINSEPPLTIDQVRRYATLCEEMSNSWFHL